MRRVVPAALLIVIARCSRHGARTRRPSQRGQGRPARGVRLVRRVPRLRPPAGGAPRRPLRARRRPGLRDGARRSAPAGGGGERARRRRRPASTTRGRTCRRRASTSPTSSRRTAKTLFVAANGRISAFDVTGRDPRLLDSIRLENAWSAQAAPARRPAARPHPGRLRVADCSPGSPASSRRTRSRPRRSRRSTFPSRRRSGWPARSSSTAIMSPPGSSAGRPASSSRPTSRRRCRSSSPDPRRPRRDCGAGAQPGRRRVVEDRRAGCPGTG